MQIILIVLQAAGQFGRHEEAAVKAVGVLAADYPGEVLGGTIGVEVLAAAVIAVAVDVLHRTVNAEFVMVVGRKVFKVQASGIDGMFRLLGHVGFVGRKVQVVTATPVLLQVVIFQGQSAVAGGLEIRTQSQSLVFQFWQLGVAVVIVVVTAPLMILCKEIQSGFLVVSYHRNIECSVVVPRVGVANVCEEMAGLPHISHGFFGDDIDGAGNG